MFNRITPYVKVIYEFNLFPKRRAGMKINESSVLKVNLSTGNVSREPVNKSYQQLLFAGTGTGHGLPVQ